MTKTKKQAVVADWLEPYRVQFLKSLADHGYAAATMRTYDAAAKELCREVSRRKLREGQFVGHMLSSAREAALVAMHPNKHDHKRFCLERFIDALVEAGVAERPRPKRKAATPLIACSPSTRATFAISAALRTATIFECASFLKRFMTSSSAKRSGASTTSPRAMLSTSSASSPRWHGAS